MTFSEVEVGVREFVEGDTAKAILFWMTVASNWLVVWVVKKVGVASCGGIKGAASKTWSVVTRKKPIPQPSDFAKDVAMTILRAPASAPIKMNRRYLAIAGTMLDPADSGEWKIGPDKLAAALIDSVDIQFVMDAIVARIEQIVVHEGEEAKQRLAHHLRDHAFPSVPINGTCWATSSRPGSASVSGSGSSRSGNNIDPAKDAAELAKAHAAHGVAP